MNVDFQELQKFNNIAYDWWNVRSKFRMLHKINPLRLEWINSHISFQGKNVVDIGCGGGILTEAMAKKGAKVTGIDLSEKAIEIAHLHSIDSGVTVYYEIISAEDLALRKPNYFDIVTCMEMLEHVPNPASIVHACSILTKFDGHVFFSTFNRNLKTYLFAILGAEYLLKLIPKGTHNYAKFITPAELAYFIRQANLEIRSLKGLSYNPITKLCTLNHNTSVNYMVACRKTSN